MITSILRTHLISSVVLIAVSGCTTPVFKNADHITMDMETKRKTDGNRKVCISRFGAPNNKPPANIVGKATVTGAFTMSVPIKTDIPVENIVTDLVRNMFSSAGFKTVPCPEADFAIHGSFDKIWVDKQVTGGFVYAKFHPKV